MAAGVRPPLPGPLRLAFALLFVLSWKEQRLYQAWASETPNCPVALPQSTDGPAEGSGWLALA